MVILISTANLVILPNLVILAILVNLVDLLTPVNLDIMVILLFIGKLANSHDKLIWLKFLILVIVVNLRIVVNLVIPKKSADSDETDDFVYYVESGDLGKYSKYCLKKLFFLGLCHPKLWVGVGQKSLTFY